MADPLTQTVEQFAPAPLNIFDQNQAETIISKYSGARRELEDAATAFDANRAVQQAEQDKYRIEQDRIRTERDALLATREDAEYAQRKEAEAMRGDLIADMYESLRPQEEGYDKRMVDFLSKARPSIQNDPVFREVLTGYNRMADKAEEQRRQDREMETRQKNTLEAIQARAKTNTFLSNLKPQDYADAPKDENGNPSLEYLYSKAAERKIENEINLSREKEKIKTMGRKELMEARNANAQLKAEAKQVEDVLINDKTAFPDRAAMVREQYKDRLGALEYATGKATLEEAEAWDKNKFDNEIIAARGYDSPEDYVDLIPNLSVDQKQSRYSLWQHANTYGGKVPPRVPEGAAPAGSNVDVEDIRTADGKSAPAGSNAIPLGNAGVEDIRTSDGVAAPAGSNAIPLGNADVEDIRTADGKSAPAGSKAIPLGGVLAESANYGNRSDGTPKGKGWLGELKLPDGSVATEYTAQSKSVKVNGKQIDFPTLVPSLTKDEIQLMVNDIIPSKKPIPDSIMQKAVDHARTRLEAGESVFAPTPTYEERTAPDGRVFRKYADGRIVEVINN